MARCSRWPHEPDRAPVEPEWLDLLPARTRAPSARARDLRRINAIMGNARISRATCGQRRRASPTSAAATAACCDAAGAKAERTWQRSCNVDRMPTGSTCSTSSRPRDAARRDRRQSVPAPLRSETCGGCSRSPRCARRSSSRASRGARAPALWASRLWALIGCNDVTRHDAVISVRAGFAGEELSACGRRPGGRLDLSESARAAVQPSLRRAPMRSFDVAGDRRRAAGATAALLLARAGRSVAVVEKAVFPRRKVCGDSSRRTYLKPGVRPADHQPRGLGGKRASKRRFRRRTRTPSRARRSMLYCSSVPRAPAPSSISR